MKAIVGIGWAFAPLFVDFFFDVMSSGKNCIQYQRARITHVQVRSIRSSQISRDMENLHAIWIIGTFNQSQSYWLYNMNKTFFSFMPHKTNSTNIRHIAPEWTFIRYSFASNQVSSAILCIASSFLSDFTERIC